MANAVAAAGAALTIWPLIDNMNPDAAVLSFSSTEADPRPIAVGSRITVRWRGGPVFVAHRASARVAQAQSHNSSPDLNEPVADASRIMNPEWLTVVGVCAHLGCIPLGQAVVEPRSEDWGCFCPCHGSKYDTSGRVRHGPAPRNLDVPLCEFKSPDVIRTG